MSAAGTGNEVFSEYENLDRGPILGAASCLRRRALQTPDAIALRYLKKSGQEVSARTFAELDLEARCLAAWLRSHGRPGDRVLLAHAPGPEFVPAFFACLYAGFIAVPAFPPRRSRHGDRVGNILRDADCRLALADNLGRAALEKARLEGGAWTELLWPEPEELQGLKPLDGHELSRPATNDLAFLQYTSGSTGTPKGVMVSHGNLEHNLRAQAFQLDFRSGDVMVSWVPFFHDMGLVLGLLLPLHNDGSGVYLSPNDFLKRPLAWLQAIHDFKGTHSCAPNFAFDLCADKVDLAKGMDLDLSEWRYCGNGSEPVQEEPMRRFEEAFAQHGVRADLVQPGYGMAENTLYISASAPGSRRVLAGGANGRALAGCGATPGHTVLVVEPVTLAERGEGEPGEIWVQSPSTANGYWRRSVESLATFGARLPGRDGTFLRTGDLGFWHQGSLVISGRLKDLIIIRGVKHHPEDLEVTAKICVHGLGPGVAFSVPGPLGESLALVQEAGSCPESEWETAALDIVRAFSLEHGLALAEFLIVGRHAVPTTSSGKVRRRACREAHLNGELKTIYRWRRSSPASTSMELAGGKPVSVAPVESGDAIGCSTAPPRQLAGTEARHWRCHPALESLWAFQKFAPSSNAYHIARTLHLDGRLDSECLREALERLAHSELALRSAFIADDQAQLWQVETSARGLLTQPWSEEGSLEQAQAWVTQWNREPFDLDVAPLWKAAYLPLESGACLLAFAFHHLIFDRRSDELFYENLQRLLLNPAAGPEPGSGLPSAPAEGPGVLDPAISFWAQYLAGLKADTWIKPSSTSQALTKPQSLQAEIPASTLAALKRQAVAGHCTLFTVAALAWAEALAEATGSQDACFLIPSTLRNRPLMDRQLGYLVHPLPLRLDADRTQALPLRLERAWARLRECLKHRQINAAHAMRTVGLHTPAAVLNYHGPEQNQKMTRFAGLTAHLSSVPSDTCLAPLCLEITDTGGWSLRLEYDSGLVDHSFARHCLKAFTEACSRYAGDAFTESLSLIKCPKVTDGPYTTVLDAFHNHARRDPRAPALITDQGAVDYGSLEAQVHAVAGVLFQAGIQAGDRVGVSSDASPAWIAALLGCFETSAVYVPLDPSYPPERLKTMLQDAGCSVVLSDLQRPEWASGWLGPWMGLEPALRGKLPYTHKPGQPRPEDSAYIIFTSGSSGRPKGVQVGHAALLNNALGVGKCLDIRPDDRVLQFFSISFDGSLLDVCPALTAGAALVLSQRKGAPDPYKMAAFVQRHRVTHFSFPTAYWHAFVEAGGVELLKVAPDLRCCQVGGEAMSSRFARTWCQKLPNTKLFNAYGPTEACISVSMHECLSDECALKDETIPLGKALPGVELAVVGTDGRLLPRGEAGELWIAGVCLAEGYIRHEGGLDQSKFFSAAPDGEEPRIFYRSGDQAVLDKQGHLIYKGRMDRQFKVAGVRMDLEEIEVVLAQAPGVAAAVVEVEGKGENLYLRAWAMAQTGQLLEPENLKAWIAQRIHATCVPSEIAVLPSFPLGPNGKIDRKALKAAGPKEAASGWNSLPNAASPELLSLPVEALATVSASPWNSTGNEGVSQKLREAFSHVLGKAVGLDDDFFILGGSSLRAVRLAGEISRRLERNVLADQIYQFPTPRSLAALLAPIFGGQSTQPGQILMPLSKGPGPDFVLLPPGSGRLAPYRGLASHFEGKCRLWGMNLNVLPAPTPGAWTAWVERTALELELALPSGDLVLGGWSMGGLLATDLVRNLKERGRNVSRLVLMDSFVPDPLSKALALHDPYVMEDAMQRDLDGGDPSSTQSSDEERRRYRLYLNATVNYELRPIQVPVSLAISERTAKDDPRASWMSWSLMAKAGMTCRLLPGDHHSVLAEGNLKRLAEFIAQDLGLLQPEQPKQLIPA